VLIALIAVLTIGAVFFLSTQASVDLAVRELIARSEGRLEVEDATGSMVDTVRVKRLAWRGPGATATATDVVLAWSPRALWSHQLVVREFGTQKLTFDLQPSDTPTRLPPTLTLPLEVSIDRVEVAQLDWNVGKNHGTIRGLEFAYAGGAVEHRVTKLSLVSQFGTVTGDAMIAANEPYAIRGDLQYKGADTFKNVDASAHVDGTLAELTIDSNGRAGDARFTSHASLTPLAPMLVREIAIDASEVDLAAWNGKLPRTRLALNVRAQPTGGGVAGIVTAENSLAGTLDAGRVPLHALSSHFEWFEGTLTLNTIAAELHGGGRATGDASIPVPASRLGGKWSLALRDIDLHHVYASLNATRLSGAVNANLDATKPKISGDIADRNIAGGVALAFAALVDGEVIEFEHFRARAGPGELEGRGRVSFTGERAFRIDAAARQFNPARLGNFPTGNLIGTIAATGTLAPKWRVDGSAVVSPGSRLSGVALSGTARGTVTSDAIRDAAIDMRIGSATLVASGSTGHADDRIKLSLDAPRLADLAPFAPAQVPQPLAGALHIKADVRGLLPQAGIDAEVKGDALKIGSAFAARSLTARVAVATGRTATGSADLASRTIAIDADAAQLVVATRTFETVRASVNGTLAQHAATVAFKDEDLDASLTAHGGFNDIRQRSVADLAWSGSIDTLENRGPWPMRLLSPASVALSHGQLRIGEARIGIADGNVHIVDFSWNDGRITTHGEFAGVPVASAARLAGVSLPVRSTLKMGGEWSLAAAPRLNGTVKLRREDGDVWLRGDGTGAKDLAAGINALEFAARIANDTVDATAMLRSARGGRADAKGSIGLPANAPAGHIAGNAPFTLTADAELPTLQLVQPWMGTVAAIDGRARVNIIGRGTVDRPLLTGTVSAEDLRIDAPRYGLHFRDGRLAAHLAENHIVLDDLLLKAGAGSFRASGTLASALETKIAPATRLTWHAEDFRLFNRPDLRLVVDGEGTITTERSKLVLTGKLKADEGRIVYVSDANAALGDDVVVKGWTRPVQPTLRSADLPLQIDLALDLGDKLTFSGEGLETGLRGVVSVATAPASGFTAKGSIRAVNGTYYAFGQKLTIDRGQLIFDGPLDNPGLDIVAMRKNQAVEAGVAVTGTVKVPIIALTSNPPVPDGEKLSWLVTGQGTRPYIRRRYGGDSGGFGRAARQECETDQHHDRAEHRSRRYFHQEHRRGAHASQHARHAGRDRPGRRGRQASFGQADAGV
jgi:translocation and assembly module TamB